MIVPGEIPQIRTDCAAVLAEGELLKREGIAVTEIGQDVDSRWQGLRPHYSAPEEELLFDATLPVRDGAAALGGRLAGVGAALVAYAEEVRPLQVRLRDLQVQAEAFVTWAQGWAGQFEHREAVSHWSSVPGKFEEHNGLVAAVNAAVAAWQEAERRCANAVKAASGSGTRYRVEDGDGRLDPEEYGASAGAYDAAAADHRPIEDPLPWGRAEITDGEAVTQAASSLAQGVVVDGLWEGLLLPLGTVAGLRGTRARDQVVAGMVESGQQAARDPLGALKEAAKGLVAWDQWEDDPGRAAGAAMFSPTPLLGTGKAAKAAAPHARALGKNVTVSVAEVYAASRAAARRFNQTTVDSLRALTDGGPALSIAGGGAMSTGLHDKPEIAISEVRGDGHRGVPDGSPHAARGDVSADMWAPGDPLPGASRADVNLPKFERYSMNPDHPANEDKYKGFTALGYDVVDPSTRIAAARDVERQLREQLAEAPASPGKLTSHGVRYEVDVLVIGPNGRSGTLHTSWQLDHGSTVPRHITNWLKVHR